MVRKWFRRRELRNDHTSNSNSTKFSVRFFAFDTLRIATNNFSTLLGSGGFGSVYKGVLPDDGRSVAVKRLSNPERDGFLEKVEFISHLRHINHIELIGCCVEHDEQLLVFEFAENGTVGDHLNGSRNSSLNWEIRAAICTGTARGLLYLHEEISPRVIHRDIKPLNILLDANFVPKIADFDLAKFADRFDESSVGEGRGTTMGRTGFGNLDSEDLLITSVKGTMGYLAPECLISTKYTLKADVYSFGLVVLEIITGRKVVDLAKDSDDRMILNWATRMRKDGTVLEMVDPKLIDFPKEDVERFINVAFLCTEAAPERRPSMFEVVLMLYGRHKSDQEIFEMAMSAVTEPVQWADENGILTPVSTDSLTNTFGEMDEAEMQARGKMDEKPSSSHKPIARNREGVSKAEAERSYTVTDVSVFFHRSMEKIIKSRGAISVKSNGTTRMTQTTVVKRFSEQVSMEVVYPPPLSGEYRPSRSVF